MAVAARGNRPVGRGMAGDAIELPVFGPAGGQPVELRLVAGGAVLRGQVGAVFDCQGFVGLVAEATVVRTYGERVGAMAIDAGRYPAMLGMTGGAGQTGVKTGELPELLARFFVTGQAGVGGAAG